MMATNTRIGSISACVKNPNSSTASLPGVGESCWLLALGCSPADPVVYVVPAAQLLPDPLPAKSQQLIANGYTLMSTIFLITTAPRIISTSPPIDILIPSGSFQSSSS